MWPAYYTMYYSFKYADIHLRKHLGVLVSCTACAVTQPLVRGAEREGWGGTSGFRSQFVCSTLMMWRVRIMVQDAAQHPSVQPGSPVCGNAQLAVLQQLPELWEKADETWPALLTPLHITQAHRSCTSLLHIYLMLTGSHPSHLSRNRLSWSSCVVGRFGSGISPTVLGNALHAIHTLSNVAFLRLRDTVRIISDPTSLSALCLSSCLDTGASPASRAADPLCLGTDDTSNNYPRGAFGGWPAVLQPGVWVGHWGWRIILQKQFSEWKHCISLLGMDFQRGEFSLLCRTFQASFLQFMSWGWTCGSHIARRGWALPVLCSSVEVSARPSLSIWLCPQTFQTIS